MTRARRLCLVALLLIGVAGCDQTLSDLTGVDVTDPDKAVIIRNADGFPNLSVLCFGTTAVITTTRDAPPVVDQGSVFCQEDGPR
ncbi:hypothetical protein BH23ACT9_BH23ACT9_15450 [soil metagenome]